MIREIRHEGQLLAIVLTHDHDEEGLRFLTEAPLSLQMGYMKYPKGHRIAAHVHLPVERVIERTLEAVIVRSGRVLVDLYASDRRHVADVELAAQDAILLASGGHGFRFLEDGALLEIKQGPCVPPRQDKEKFTGAGE
ncbi:MAG: hypothetical protein KGO96_03985 [Elusimicrobia bacterium]|nr:hypothetical protein [Elusimicrobiota bacterium]MDE2236835.1 hypothetical protein [Elusimicrobiota bacterium]MDE2425053.1 hypothetical protein [Elusimicrobiota bacterium]